MHPTKTNYSHQKHRAVLLRWILSAVLFSTAAVLALAQNRNTAELLGAVTDSSGGILANAEITIANDETQTIIHARSNQAGLYNAPYLQPGSYTVSFELKGFTTLKKSNIELQVGQTARVNATMEVGTTTTVVTVTNSAPLLNTDDSQRGTNFSQQLVTNLPLVGRDPSALAVLSAGTSTAQSSVSGGDPGRRSVNGNRSFSISATVNGGSVVLPGSDNFSSFIPAMGSVSEFTVIQDNFSAEFGSGTSVLNMITKSGSNQFHGMLFEFLQNDKLNARNAFAQSKPPLRYNQFGGNLGGPIVRDKLFFFFSYQNTLSPSSSINVRTVPSEALKTGNFLGLPTIIDPRTNAPFPGNRFDVSRIDPVALAIQSYWPSPTQSGDTNNYYRAAPQNPRNPYYDGKADYYIAPQNQLTGSFHIYNLSNQHTGSYPGSVCFNSSEYCALQISDNEQWQLSDRWTISPDTINEFRANYVRQFFQTVSPSAGQDFPVKLGLKNVPDEYFPNITISGAVPTSISPGTHIGGAQNIFSYADNATWVHNRHTLKFGVELVKYQDNSLGQWDSGSFGFSGLFTGVGYADFLLGLPNSYSLSAQPNTMGARRTAVAGFLQDDFHPTRNLTLNIGVRYQFEGGFSEAHNRLANFNPTLINPITNTPGVIEFATPDHRTLQQSHDMLFAPRVGLAWSVSHDLVVRGSYGIFYVPISAGANFNSSPPGYAIQQSLQTTDLKTPIFQLSDGPPPYQIPNPSNRTGGVLNGQAISYWPYYAAQPYVQEWHFSIQKQFFANTMVETSYVGNKGTYLLFPRDLNQVPPSLLGPGNAQPNRPYPQYQAITARFNDANSSYQALQIQAQHRYAHGLTVLTNYTFSKSLDDSSYEQTTGIGNEYQIANQPNLNHALSQFDQTHRFVAAYVYELPFGQGRAFLNKASIWKATLGGWQTSGSFTANTGFPFSVYQGGTNTSNSLGGSLFPNRLRNGSLPSGQQSAAAWFDTGAFAAPALYTFGNSGRDILRGPGFWDYDFALMRDFRIPLHLSEQSRLQFRGDFFNLFNHPNLGQPTSTTGSGAFGTITSASSPRTIQLGLQLLF
jgi:hypothetical protein